MNYFNKKNVVILVIAILLIVNVATISTILFRTYNKFPGHPRMEKQSHKSYKDFWTKLDLNEEQKEAFGNFKKQYRKETQIIFRELHDKRVLMMDEFTDIGVDAVIEEALSVVGDGPTYITFDVDGLDPVYAPGTGTPEIGGITTVEALKLLRGLRGLNLVGGDVVEVAPPFDQTGNTALVGATLMFEILCLLAESKSS